MDRLILEEKLESLRRCVRRLEDKRATTAAALRLDVDRQDIIALNLTRAMQLCVDWQQRPLCLARPTGCRVAQEFRLLAELQTRG